MYIYIYIFSYFGLPEDNSLRNSPHPRKTYPRLQGEVQFALGQGHRHGTAGGQPKDSGLISNRLESSILDRWYMMVPYRYLFVIYIYIYTNYNI